MLHRSPVRSILLVQLVTILILANLLQVSPVSVAAQDGTPFANPDPIADIPALLENCDSIFGVVILDPDGKTVFAQNPDLPFVSASLYKLVLLAQTFDRVEQGELALSDTVEILPEYFADANGEDSYFSNQAIGYFAPIEELVYSAGSYSSNVGAQALISLTNMESLEEYAFTLGMSDTRYRVTADELADLYGDSSETAADGDFARAMAFVGSFAGSEYVNVTTPGDIATFFHRVSTDTMVSPLVSWRIKQVLTARVINDRLPALLPATTAVIHKTGNLYGVLHDAGIIETPEGPMITVAMAQAVTDYNMTFSVEQRLGLLAWELGGGSPAEPEIPGTPAAVGRSPSNGRLEAALSGR